MESSSDSDSDSSEGSMNEGTEMIAQAVHLPKFLLSYEDYSGITVP